MKIAIEAQRIFRSNKHGMDFVVLEQLRRIQQIDKENEYFVFVAPGSDHCLEETERMHIIELKCPTFPLWEQIALRNAVRHLKVDMLHCTSNTAPLFCPVPLILTLHDVIYMERWHSGSRSWYQRLGWHYRRFVVPRIVQKCSAIITVSHTEQANICRRLNLLSESVQVLHNGYGKQYSEGIALPEILTKYKIEAQQYFFFMGNTEPRKNTRRVLKAYNLYRASSSRHYPLLISGLEEAELDRLLEEEQLIHLKPYLIFPGYLPGEDMPTLFRGAFAYLFPSLSEGFGIPIIEAMACGTPVITSNLSAMPEVAGEGALLIDPYQETEIADAMMQLENSNELYEKQKKYGLERVLCFSWEENARKLLEIYQKTYQEK